MPKILQWIQIQHVKLAKLNCLIHAEVMETKQIKESTQSKSEIKGRLELVAYDKMPIEKGTVLLVAPNLAEAWE